MRKWPRVLVACEFSGTVRNAFRRAGCDAWSCDLLPSETDGPHIIGDVRAVLAGGWDLVVAFPPCTALCVSGNRWYAGTPAREEALGLVRDLLAAPAPRLVLENSVGVISTRIAPPSQVVHPWQFGHDASKATCLWIRGLPLLVPTDELPGGRWTRRANQTASGQNKVGPSPDRWRIRSRTYAGVARAMAQQWAPLLSGGPP